MPATQSSKELHVAVLAFPFGNHDLTILGPTCRLACAAPNVQFSFLSTEKKSNDSMFSAFKPDVPDNTRAYNVEDGVPMNHVFSGNPVEILELFLKAAPGNFMKGLDVAVLETGRNISCLVTDVFLTFAADMAKDMQVSWTPLCVLVPHNLIAHIYTDLIRRFFNHVVDENGANFQHQTSEFIPRLSGMYVTDLSDEILPIDSKETFFAYMLSKIGCILPRATAIFMNFCQELYPAPLLDHLKSMFPNLLHVGFLTTPPPLPPSDSDATGCLSWLVKQKSKSVAYISFGTAATPPGDELIALADAVEENHVPFLWSLTDNHKHHLPNAFLQRTSMYGKIVSWAPQTQVLASWDILQQACS